MSAALNLNIGILDASPAAPSAGKNNSHSGLDNIAARPAPQSAENRPADPQSYTIDQNLSENSKKDDFSSVLKKQLVSQSGDSQTDSTFASPSRPQSRQKPKTSRSDAETSQNSLSTPEMLYIPAMQTSFLASSAGINQTNPFKSGEAMPGRVTEPPLKAGMQTVFAKTNPFSTPPAGINQTNPFGSGAAMPGRVTEPSLAAQAQTVFAKTNPFSQKQELVRSGDSQVVPVPASANQPNAQRASSNPLHHPLLTSASATGYEQKPTSSLQIPSALDGNNLPKLKATSKTAAAPAQQADRAPAASAVHIAVTPSESTASINPQAVLSEHRKTNPISDRQTHSLLNGASQDVPQPTAAIDKPAKKSSAPSDKTLQGISIEHLGAVQPENHLGQSVSHISETGAVARADAVAKAEALKPADQVIQHIPTTITGSVQQIRMSLSPEELGTIRLTFRQEDGQVQGVIEVERPSVQKDIEKALPQIAAAMSESGIQVRRIDVVPMQNNPNNQNSPFTPDPGGSDQHYLAGQASDDSKQGGSPHRGHFDPAAPQQADDAALSKPRVYSDANLNMYA